MDGDYGSRLRWRWESKSGEVKYSKKRREKWEIKRESRYGKMKRTDV